MKGNWIWINNDTSIHSFVRFRKKFTVGKVEPTMLRITAETRYFLYINGVFVGNGPVRGYPEHYFYDEYDITSFLCFGENVIAVLVLKYGLDTFQSLHAREGLLMQAEGAANFVSDASVLCSFAKEYSQHAPEICIQQFLEEHFNGEYFQLWQEPGFDDTLWESAKELSCGIEDGYHFDLHKRPIPFFDRTLVVADRCMEMVCTENRFKIISYDFRKKLIGLLKNTNTSSLGNYGVCISFVADRDCMAEIRYEGFATFYINGEKGTKNVHLQRGVNRIYYEISGYQIAYSHIIALATEVAVSEVGIYFAGFFEVPEKIIDSYHDLGIYQIIEARSGAGDEQTIKTALKKNDFEYVKDFLLDFSDCIVDCDVEAECRYADVIDSPVKGVEFSDTKIVFAPSDKDVRILLDFGTEIYGYINFDIVAEKSATIDVFGFEFIQPDGIRNYCDGMRNSLRVIVKTGKLPFRSIIKRGFRYCYIIVHKHCKTVSIQNFHAEFCTYPQTGIGDFECDNELLNQIYQTCRATLCCCSDDTYIDCPTYEQTFWVGDARNEALVDWLLNGDSRLWLRCLELVAQSLEKAPITLSLLPAGWYNIIPTWSFLWMRSICEYDLYIGDENAIRKLIPAMLKNLDGVERYINEYSLFEISSWNMFDWAPMDTPDNAIVVHQNCTLVQVLRQCSALLKKYGNLSFSFRYMTLANQIAESINRYAYNCEKGAYTDCLRRKDGTLIPSTVYSQQTQAAAIAAKIPMAENWNSVLEKVIDPPKDFVQSGSPFFQFFLLEILAETGNYQKMLDVILRDWGFMLSKGASTFWEMWSIQQKQGRLTRSHCHGWGTAPVLFLTEYILGVKPIQSGYKEIVFEPHPCGLRSAKGKIPTPLGVIEVHWEYKDDKIIKDIRLPEGIRCKSERSKGG